MDELEALRRRIEARVADPKLLLVPGLKVDLQAIANGFGELERRIGVLAVVALQKHYRPQAPLHEAVWQSLAEMSDHAGAVYRIGVHGDQCTCMECMAQSRGAYRSAPTKR